MPVPAYTESEIIDRFNRVQAGLNRGKSILINGLTEARAMFDQSNADANAINDFIEDYYDSAYGILQQAIIDLCEIGNVVAPTMTKGANWTWSKMARANTNGEASVNWRSPTSATSDMVPSRAIFGVDADGSSLYFSGDVLRVTRSNAIVQSGGTAGEMIGKSLTCAAISGATANEAVDGSGNLELNDTMPTPYDDAYVNGQAGNVVNDTDFEARLTSKA